MGSLNCLFQTGMSSSNCPFQTGRRVVYPGVGDNVRIEHYDSSVPVVEMAELV